MYSHVTVGADDVGRARAFYDAVLPIVGLQVIHVDGDTAVGYAAHPDRTPQFWVVRPLDGKAATVGNGVTVAFEVPARERVDAFHAAALAAGGSDEGPPGLRPHYHADYYGAYMRDPQGNKICVVCHAPA